MKQRDLWTWRRGKAVRDYIPGKKVLAIAADLEVSRAAVNQVASVVRHCWYRSAAAPEGAWAAPQAHPGVTRGAHPADRGGAAGDGLHRRHLDGPTDRRV